MDARLIDRAPSLAPQISMLAAVLLEPQRKAVYTTLCRLRDEVFQELHEHCAEPLWRSLPDVRKLIWRECCRLTRFYPEQSQLRVGPVGAEALADRGRLWLIQRVLAPFVFELDCQPQEYQAGIARRELWQGRCRSCGQADTGLMLRINWLDPIPGLLEEAIRQAEKLQLAGR